MQLDCVSIRLRVYLVKESSPVVPIKNTPETPRCVSQRLYIQDLDSQHVTGFCGLDIKWPRKVMDLSEIHVLEIICTVIVLDLASGPVHAFD